MEVQIIATHACRHRLDLERELLELGIPFDLVFVEDHHDLARRYQIRHSRILSSTVLSCFGDSPQKVN